jgi:hypothetical protein
MSERRRKVLEKSLKIPKDVMDVMAQTKRLVEDTTHLDVSVKRLKEMARAPKQKRKVEGKGFQFFKILVFI